MVDNYLAQNLTPAITAAVQQDIIIPLRLEDLYARVQDNRIFNMFGYSEVGEASEDSARKAILMESGGSRLFLNAANMFSYLYRNMGSDWCNKVINIVVPGLRNLYWKYRYLLHPNEQAILATCMEQQLPNFTDVYSYQSLKYYEEIANIHEYQLIGTITPYDIVHIPIINYIDSLNNKQTIKVKLDNVNVFIYITYKDYDFWDNEYQALLTHIDLNKYCRRGG
ncbi:Hypothetical protein HVR_LOCUS247 [uncultured virus]|nr:Hypothetical protein HVR_LOCUS247 [uncultured virus]